MRRQDRAGEGECYQVNSGVRAVYDDQKRSLESLEVNGVVVNDMRHYTLGLTGYHADNCTKNINIAPEELAWRGGFKVIATSTTNVIEEYLRAHPNLTSRIEGRLGFRAA